MAQILGNSASTRIVSRQHRAAEQAVVIWESQFKRVSITFEADTFSLLSSSSLQTRIFTRSMVFKNGFCIDGLVATGSALIIYNAGLNLNGVMSRTEK